MEVDKTKIQAVWDKGKPVDGYDPHRWRKDKCGAWLFKIRYGDRDSEWGWVIHSIDSNNGDKLSNLIPLHTKNSVVTGDGPLQCPVKASEPVYSDHRVLVSGGRNTGV
ncbi:MAG: HNH endonuclease [Candidatus Bathyarchaeota archaeon]|jgi:hypothetical protein|nr:HNH endonuclease [Candidatus Bathyarchaeota archaeon]MDP7208077.1 HNH endonuclease [Candidatus Bathyarchaeota archaeon]MDP7443072.1 HNH endonuclease [Candidatus Bathyarchaeota archaeon]|tara:strand:- start:390 stop:713 length:324 start_codon:yes stop_codon:yes gene_type:complete